MSLSTKEQRFLKNPLTVNRYISKLNTSRLSYYITSVMYQYIYVITRTNTNRV